MPTRPVVTFLAIACLQAAACGPEASTALDDAALIAPPPKGQGFQFATEDIEVPSGVEEQDCYFYRVRDLAASGGLDPEAPVNLHRVQLAQRSGSHHMNLFRVRTIAGLGPEGGLIQKNRDGVGECFKSSNWSDWPLVANTQKDGEVDWTFPEGVANVLGPDEWLMLQTHYVNATTQTMDQLGRVTVNFWTIPDNEVKAEMGTLFASKQSVRVCRSNPRPTYEGTCQFNNDEPITIIGANAHFHSRGRTFEMYRWDGISTQRPGADARFYQSDAWDEPPMPHSPDLTLPMPAKSGVWYAADYQWQPPPPSIGCEGLDAADRAAGTPEEALDCCYTFGPIVERNEHCNIFAYYYPKQDDVTCF